MRIDELDFPFPEELIAQRPCEPRDACRLLVADPVAGSVSHHVFSELPAILRPGDVLVLNESKVLPARVEARRETGGRVELLFLRPAVDPGAELGTAATRAGEAGTAATRAGEAWEVLARPSSRLKAGGTLTLAGGERLRLLRALGEGRWIVEGPGAPGIVALLDRYGVMPLPPYIRERPVHPDDYQTVYAAAPGSAAAPTAGLHFTPRLLDELTAGGIQMEKVALHVGVETFRPVTEETVEEHVIHTEAYEASEETIGRLDAARAEGRRLVAVGTTSVRVLETLYRDSSPRGPALGPRAGGTGVYITPGYRFRAVDALLTNFHLPRTTLLALVMAFGGVAFVREVYEAAVAERYRFFSFGDAMLLTRREAGA